MNNGVMGSMFTRYKSPALVNLDWTTTFTPELLRKDLDLGLGLGTEIYSPAIIERLRNNMLDCRYGAVVRKLAMGLKALIDLDQQHA